MVAAVTPRMMNRALALQLMPGDVLDPSDWNSVTPPWSRDKIASPAKVLEIDREARSQTGVMVTLAAKRGTITVDAGWFKPLVKHE